MQLIPNINQINNCNNKLNKMLVNSNENLNAKVNKMYNYINRPDHLILNSDHQGQFNQYLRKGYNDNLVQKALTNKDDEGKILVTPAMHNQIINNIDATSVMRSLAGIENISSSALDFVLEDGAFNSGWVGEEQERIVTDSSKLKQKRIYVHEMYAQPKATQRLVDDASINIESWLGERLKDSFTKTENEAFINGDGDKKPFGILKVNEIEQVELKKVITTDDILKLVNALDEPYQAGAKLLMNRKTLIEIQKLKDTNGRFIWQQSMSESLKSSIFGIEVVCMSQIPTIDDDSLSIIIGDFKVGYKIVDRSGIHIMRDPYTDKPFVKFYAVKRVGGDVIDPKAFKIAKFVA